MITRLTALLLLIASSALADYVEARQQAASLKGSYNYEEALAAFSALAEGEYSDFQIADALYEAAECARNLKQYEQAEAFAERCPIDTVADSIRIQNLGAQGQHQALVDQYGEVDLTRWPSYEAVWAHVARGRAFMALGQGEKAEADLSRAVMMLGNDRSKPTAAVWGDLAENRLKNLEQPERALEAYTHIAEMVGGGSGGSTHFRALLDGAALLSSRGEHDKAIEWVGHMDPDSRKGYWGQAAMLTKGRLLVAAGQPEEARECFQSILDDEKSSQRNLQTAQEELDKLAGEAP